VRNICSGSMAEKRSFCGSSGFMVDVMCIRQNTGEGIFVHNKHLFKVSYMYR